MIRSKPMSRGVPMRADKPDRSAEFASWTPKARPAAPAVMANDLGARLPAAQVAKVHGRVDQRIRDSARGEQCQVRIVGVCTGSPEHTVWSHAPLGAAGKGRGIKAVDLAGAYCCTACDAVVDGQAPLPPGTTRESVLLDWFMGHMRSLVLLVRKGLA